MELPFSAVHQEWVAVLRVRGVSFLFSTWRKSESGSGASFKMVLIGFMVVSMLRWRLGTRLSPTIW